MTKYRSESAVKLFFFESSKLCNCVTRKCHVATTVRESTTERARERERRRVGNKNMANVECAKWNTIMYRVHRVHSLLIKSCRTRCSLCRCTHSLLHCTFSFIVFVCFSLSLCSKHNPMSIQSPIHVSLQFIRSVHKSYFFSPSVSYTNQPFFSLPRVVVARAQSRERKKFWNDFLLWLIVHIHKIQS